MQIPKAMAALRAGNDFPQVSRLGKLDLVHSAGGLRRALVWEGVCVSMPAPKAQWWAEEPLIFPRNNNSNVFVQYLSVAEPFLIVFLFWFWFFCLF